MYFFLLSLLDNFQLRVGDREVLGRVQDTKLLHMYSCISVRSTNICKLIFSWLSCKVYWFAYLRGPVLLLFIDILARASSLKYWTFYM